MNELNELKIKVKYLKDLDAAEKDQLRHLLRSAFPGEDWVNDVNGPGDDDQLLFLGKLKSSIISAVGIVVRDIQVGDSKLRVGGIGGVATLPDHRSRGYAARLMEVSTAWMRKATGLDFGMLFCSAQMIPFYEHQGYRLIKNCLLEIVNDVRTEKDDQVMILDLGKNDFPAGDIEVTGYTW